MILVDNFYEILKKTNKPVAVLIENKTFFEKQKKLNINNNNICISSKKVPKKIYQVFKSYNKVYN